MKKIIIVIFTFIILPFYLESKDHSYRFQPGESLVYEVSFIGIKLGKIEIESVGSEEINGNKVFYAKTKMDSYDGIPFVDLHSTFYSWFDKSISYSHQFASNTKVEDNQWEYFKINFDYDTKTSYSTTWLDKKIKERDTVDTSKKLNDGTSLLFFARKFLDYGKKVHVPTIVNNMLGTTILNFRNAQEYITIDLFKKPVRSLVFDGVAEWEGVYGLRGSFEGWFSDDEARVPLLAYMNVYIGRVKIELIEYKRSGWEIPY